jgi:predicted transport protein
MAIYRINQQKLIPVNFSRFDLEKDIQKLTEKNLNTIFGLRFVSGALNQEFFVKVQEQDFYIDTLAFDENQNSIVIIEYKKDRSFSVIDQGFAYLSAMLAHKADFILELNERLGKSFTKKDIDWEFSRIIFVSTEFTNYQRNAINFKDLPIYLYEVRLYENNLIDFSPIKPLRTSDSIKKLTSDITIQRVTKEIKTYAKEDLVPSSWSESNELLHQFELELFELIPDTRIKYTKKYIAYLSRHGRNYIEIVPNKRGLKLYFRFFANNVKSMLKIIDCSKIGHWTNGKCFTLISEVNQIPEAIKLSKQSYEYLHRDVYARKTA